MAFLSWAVIGVVVSMLGGNSSAGTVPVQYQSSPHTIALGPSQATAGPGEFVEYTVSVGSLQGAFSGSVLVIVPAGLVVTDQLQCLSGCGQPTVSGGATDTQIEFAVDIYGDEWASLSFQVRVDENAVVGTSIQLTAYLLGGVNTAGGSETAFATLVVTEGVSGPGSVPDSGPLDDRQAYLDVTPRALHVVPGGWALYFVQPVFWGDWSASLPDYTIELQLPAGAELPTEPVCGARTSVVPEVSSCVVTAQTRGDGSIVLTARPGFVGVNSNGLYVTVKFEADLPINTSLQIHSSLDLPGNLPVSAPAEQSLAVLVVDSSAISSPSGGGMVAGRLEAHVGGVPNGDSCSVADPSSDYELALFEWGAPDLALARIQLPEGRIGAASDGQSGDVCIIHFRFDNVPEYSIYMVAQLSVGQINVCRACVLGLITTSQGAEQVVVRE